MSIVRPGRGGKQGASPGLVRVLFHIDWEWTTYAGCTCLFGQAAVACDFFKKLEGSSAFFYLLMGA